MADLPELPLVGDDFAGFRLRAVLGRGGMSVVYQAENPRLGSVIALKVLAPELAADDAFRARFLEESRIAASLNHPNVIPIYDTGSSRGLLYIAMRYVAGTDLRQMIKKRGRVLPATAVFLLAQAARALDAAHRQGLVHRDVKPGNLLIERGSDDEDPDHLYLTDFGITKHAMSRSGLTATGQFLGTIDYVAPEQIQGTSVLGQADQYSLGCVLYEVPDTQAAGRVFCDFGNAQENFVWTQDDGHMLGYVAGPVHEDVWNWWVGVHHNIGFAGSPMNM
ncbi:MAG: serine/threonine-protein kinase [Streptosporangiaceae bacterium]